MDFISDISTEDLLGQMRQYYRQLTGEDLQIGSEGFAVASTVAYICGVLVVRFNAQARQRYLATATGVYLDALGETFDLPRPGPTHATLSVRLTASAPPAGTLVPGRFRVGTPAGARFTPVERISPAEVMAGGPFPFIGVSQDISTELGITAGTPLEIVTFVGGLEAAEAAADSAGGSAVGYPYTDAGDAAYREYIVAMRSATSAGGPAAAYEMRAKKTSAAVLDAYCLRYDDPGWVAGVAHVYILTGDGSDVTATVEAALKSPDWKPVCDTVEVTPVQPTAVSIRLRVGLTATDAVSGPAKIAHDLEEYAAELRGRLGSDFSISELARRCQTPDAEGVRSVYVTCVDPTQNYVPMRRWECGDFTLVVEAYETVDA